MKRFHVITIKTDPDTAEEIESLRRSYDPQKSISEMGHILLRVGAKNIKRIRLEAMESGYISAR